jgi:hypothetical protein
VKRGEAIDEQIRAIDDSPLHARRVIVQAESLPDVRHVRAEECGQPGGIRVEQLEIRSDARERGQ